MNDWDMLHILFDVATSILAIVATVVVGVMILAEAFSRSGHR